MLCHVSQRTTPETKKRLTPTKKYNKKLMTEINNEPQRFTIKPGKCTIIPKFFDVFILIRLIQCTKERHS